MPFIIFQDWSPFPLPNCQGSYNIEDDDPERSVYTHEEYINLVLRSGQIMSHDYSNQSMDEDPRMMAFFDSLVQRELEEWSTDDSLSSNEEFYSRFMQMSNSDDTANESGSHSEDGGFSPFTLAFASVVTNISGGQENESNLLDLDEHTARIAAARNQEQSEGQGETSGLEGQRPGNTRRSISGLIAQKRREYLMNLRRNHEHESKTKRKKLKILKRRAESSSDSTSNSKGKKKKSHRLSDTSSDSESNSDRESTSKSERKLKFSSSKKQRPHLRKLNRLRALIENSGTSESDSGQERVKFKSKEFISSSDSSDTDQAKVTKTKTGRKVTKTEVKSTKTEVKICLDVVPSTSGVNTKSKANSSDDDGLYGPYLEAANSNNRSDHPGSASHYDKTDNQVLYTDIGLKTSANTNGLDSKTTASCSHSNPMEPAATSSQTNTTEASVNGRENPTGDITWAEFKRFRNRLERARRYYRRKSQPDESSDED
jgi:WD repeat-containing protein 22